MPLSEDQKKEKKRLAERRRMENIRKYPDKYALWKLKMKEMYLKRKEEGKIVSVQNLPPKQQKFARKKSRESSRRWYAKKKLKERDIHSEEEVIDECDPADNTEINDPLDLEITSSPEVSITPRSPEIPSSAQIRKRPCFISGGQQQEQSSKPNMHDCALRTETPVDEYTTYGELVAMKLKKIGNAYARSTAQYHINNILYKAEIGEYDKHSRQITPYNAAEHFGAVSPSALHDSNYEVQSQRSSSTKSVDLKVEKIEESDDQSDS